MEVATTYPERIDRAVLVSPAGGPNNRPLGRALRQMAVDGTREPLGMVPIATRDYLRFGVPRSLALFGAMTRYPTLERLHNLSMPTLLIAGTRDPLVNHGRVHVLSGLPHIQVVRTPGAHALNFSRPGPVADLIEAFLDDQPLEPVAARHGAEVVAVT
jgi:pimeloyl-ACP methyl ester carboxylesterase